MCEQQVTPTTNNNIPEKRKRKAAQNKINFNIQNF